MSSDSCVWNDTLCNELGVNAMLIDHVSQRDISYKVGVDQAFMPGISVNNMGSNWEQLLQTSLAVGFRALYMDFTWINGGWDLCPDTNETCATISDVSSVVYEFISQTDTNIEVDLLRMGFRFRIDPESINEVSRMQLVNLTAQVELVQSRALTPQSVVANQQASTVSSDAINRQDSSTLWPSLQTTLLDSKARVFLTTDTSLIPANISLDFLNGTAFDTSTPVSGLSTVPWPDLAIPNLTYNELANIPFRSVSIGDGEDMQSDWISAIRAGYSPVLNGTISYDTLRDLAPYCEWPWAPTQPTYESDQTRQTLLDNQTYSMCAAQTPNGWVRGNCHDDAYILCLSTTDSFDWQVVDLYTPFTATSDAESCPDGYKFTSPRSHLQNSAALAALASANVSYAWTSVNSLTLENCWVVGINTYCPYNTVQGNRNGVGVLTVVSAIGFGLVVAMALLEYRQSKLPLRPQKLTKRSKSKTKDTK